jgi:hypothetical protein
MTTLKELGEMLIEVYVNNRELEECYQDGCEWSSHGTYKTGFSFDLKTTKYRLKPVIIYYRAT